MKVNENAYLFSLKVLFHKQILKLICKLHELWIYQTEATDSCFVLVKGALMIANFLIFMFPVLFTKGRAN